LFSIEAQVITVLGTHDVLIFIASGLLLNFTPGPDTLYIIGRSTTQGLRAGVVAALGIGVGILVHITAAAVGLSAILVNSATAFSIVKMVGAAYLVYVGISMLRSSGIAARATRALHQEPAALKTVFLQGFFTNVLNPKVALFFLAFLPQFVDMDAANKPLAFLFLGAIFNLNGTLCNLFVAWSAARVTGRLGRSASFTKWLNRCLGGLFILLGVRLAFAKTS
jgi:threonine/homoserine/homoserine lactone efflux protein